MDRRTCGQGRGASPDDVNKAVEAARRAFDATDWATNKQLRFDLVSKLYHLLVANRERLASLARYEAGAAVGAIPRAQVAGDLPFGGYKASGLGREWGVEGIEEYLETKVLAWRV